MKNLSSINKSVVAIAVMTVALLAPYCCVQAQTSKNFGRALTKGIKGNQKELPSLKPMREQTFNTSEFYKQNVKMPSRPAQQKSALQTGVALGYGNSQLFKDMEKLKKDSLNNYTVKADVPKAMR